MSNTFVARAYNNFETLPHGRIRKSSMSNRLADEILYYSNVHSMVDKRISSMFPRLFDYCISYGDNDASEMILEQYDYKTLGYYMLDDWGFVRGSDRWMQAMNDLSSILDMFREFVDPQPADSSYIIDMLLHKTSREYNALVLSRIDLLPLFESPHIVLNNRLLRNFTSLQPELVDYVMSNMLDYTSTVIHGDMCFSNILYGSFDGIIRLIDPRGSFGKRGIYGDQRYDVAKLLHSVDGGYELFINDKFEVTSTDSQLEWALTLNGRNQRTAALQAFNSTFFDTGKFKKKDIMIIAGTIFIGMCARHYDSTTRQEAMYLTGLRLLNEALAL